MKLHFHTFRLFWLTLFLQMSVTLCVSAAALAKTNSDSLIIQQKFEDLLGKIGKLATSKDDFFIYLLNAQDTMSITSLPPQYQSYTYSLFETVYRKLGQFMEYRTDELNLAVIKCLKYQQGFTNDTDKRSNIDREITRLYNQGLPVAYENYKLNNVKYKPLFMFYLEQFSAHDPQNHTLMTIKGMAKHKSVNIIFIVFVLLLLVVYFFVVSNDTHKKYEKGQKNAELSELILVFTLTLLFFFSFFIKFQYFNFVGLALILVPVSGVVCVLFIINSRAIQVLNAPKFLAGSACLVIGLLFILTNHYRELIFTVIGSGIVFSFYKFGIFKNTEFLVFLFFLIPAAYFIVNSDEYMVCLGLGISEPVRNIVVISSVITFIIMLTVSSFRVVKTFSVISIIVIVFSAIVYSVSFLPNYFYIGLTGIGCLLIFRYFLIKAKKVFPLTLKYFTFPIYDYLDDKKKMGASAGTIISMSAEYPDKLMFTEYVIIRDYCEGHQLNDPISKDKLYAIAQHLDSFLKNKPDNATRFWIDCLSTCSTMKGKILLLDWFMQNKRHDDAEHLISGINDKDSFDAVVFHFAKFPREIICFINKTVAGARLASGDLDGAFADFNALVQFYPKSEFQDVFEKFLLEGYKKYKYIRLSEKLFNLFVENSNSFCFINVEESLIPLIIPGEKHDPWITTIITAYCHYLSKPWRYIFEVYAGLGNTYKHPDFVFGIAVNAYVKKAGRNSMDLNFNPVPDPAYQKLWITVIFDMVVSSVNHKDYMIAFNNFVKIPNPSKYFPENVLVKLLYNLSKGLYENGNHGQAMECMEMITKFYDHPEYSLKMVKLYILCDENTKAEKLLKNIITGNQEAAIVREINDIKFKLDIITGKISPLKIKTEIKQMLGFDYFELVNSALHHDVVKTMQTLKSIDPKYHTFKQFTESFLDYSQGLYPNALEKLKKIKISTLHHTENSAILHELNNLNSIAKTLRKKIIDQTKDDLSKYWQIVWLIILSNNLSKTNMDLKKLYYEY